MMKPDVSVIMPVYNSEKYLLQAAHSVLNQSYKNIELILVDDGSEDQSGRLCDELALEDIRVKVIHKKNGGICSARNAGLNVANGEYIGFCDNDDEYMSGLIEENYVFAKKYNADIIRFGRKRIETRNGRIVLETLSPNFGFMYIPSKEFIIHYEKVRESLNGVWAGLYKRSFLREKSICFNKSFKYGVEDILFNLLCYREYPNIVLNPKIYYCWKQRMEHSTTGKFNENLIDSLLICMGEEWKFVQNNKIQISNRGLWQWLLVEMYYSELLARISPVICNNTNKEKKEFLSRLRNSADISYKSGIADLRYLKKKGILIALAWLLIKYKYCYLLYTLINLKKVLMKKQRDL